MTSSSTIKQHALEVGFDLVGVAPPSAVKDLEFLPQWVKNGCGGEMRYLADPRREDPRNVLASVQSIICVGLIYNTVNPYSTEIAKQTKRSRVSPSGVAPAATVPPRAWISRYAWGEDYHEVMRRKLEQLRKAIEKLAPNVDTRVYVDTGPIVERAFARLSGVGWMGKNTCLINEQKGSWFFLGVILTNLQLELDLAAPDRCGSCTRCLEACPTGALVQPYVMDASRCISYFNIELRGNIPEEFRTAIGANVFGCDICQDVCPWNNRSFAVLGGPLLHGSQSDGQPGAGPAPRQVATSDLYEFQPMQIETMRHDGTVKCTGEARPVAQSSDTAQFSLFNPRLESLASITEQNFRRIFARSPIKRAKYRGWLRNLCVAMGNSGDRQFIAWLEAAADDPDAIVREHASWALRKLQDGG
jgi:epoxyqueuosine reductase